MSEHQRIVYPVSKLDSITQAARSDMVWSEEEEKNLENSFKVGEKLEHIAYKLQRTQAAVAARMRVLGMLQIDYDGYYRTTYYVNPNWFRKRKVDIPYSDVEQEVAELIGKPKTVSQPKQPKEDKMAVAIDIKLESKTLINGLEAALMSDESLYDLLVKAETQISKWEAIKTKPNKLVKQIEDLKGRCKELADYIDSRDAKGE